MGKHRIPRVSQIILPIELFARAGTDGFRPGWPLFQPSAGSFAAGAGGRSQPRDGKDILFIQRFPGDKGGRQGVQLPPVHRQQPFRFVKAFPDNPEDLFVNDLSGLFAERFCSPESRLGAEVGILRGASCTMPSRSLMPHRVTILQASPVACSMSLSAPVVFVP